MTYQPFFLINTCAPQILLTYLFLAAPEASFFFLYSFFFVLISFFFPCSHTVAPSHHSPPSLTENHRYPSLRMNQILTKVLTSVVGKYICLFLLWVFLMVVWFALVSLPYSLIWLLKLKFVVCEIRKSLVCKFIYIYIYIYIDIFYFKKLWNYVVDSVSEACWELVHELAKS